MDPLLLALVVGLTMLLAYYNGFHDASNAVSTTITTRTLKESSALLLAAVLNLLGGLLGLLVIPATATWALDLLRLHHLYDLGATDPDLLGWALVVILLTTLGWEVLTWWMGMPSSSWHAFFGSTLGVTATLGVPDAFAPVIALLVIAAVLGPLLGAIVSFTTMRGVLAFGRAERLRIGHLRFAQTITASAVATGHGMSDSRLPFAVLLIALTATGSTEASTTAFMIPIAVAMALGTLAGGHRIIRTIGRRLTDLSSAQGMAAETSAAVVMGLAVIGFDVPISTSHTLSSSVVGAGTAIGPRQVRWKVAATMVGTWLAAPVATAVVGAAAIVVVQELI
ncbi:anion permease [Brachybacterium sp. DNPG3]